MAKPAYRSKQYQANRRAILASHPACAICNLHGADTVDHITPISQGGTGALYNLRPAHGTCNSRRGASKPYGPYTAAY